MPSILIAIALILASLVSPPSVAEKSYDNTVVVHVERGHGSGVLFSRGDQTFVWTVGHVADCHMNDDGTFREFTIRQGDKRGTARAIRVGDSYIEQDIALLQVTSGNIAGDAHFYRAFNEIKLGQQVVHCGTPFYPRLNERLILYGRISHVGRMFSFRDQPIPRELDQCNVSAYPGCSGGPVFDAKTGGIIGLMSIGGNPCLTAIVPTRAIYEWAKKHDCLWAFDPEVPMPSSITPWRSDALERLIRQRDTSAIDDRWGSKPEPEPEPEPEPTPAPEQGVDLSPGGEIIELPVIWDRSVGRYHLRKRTGDFFKRSVVT